MIIKIYKIDEKVLADVKKILEEPEGFKEIEGKQEYVKNEFARNGYTLRDAKSIGIEENCSYLYIKGEEIFFKENEKKIKIEGVKILDREEFEKIKGKIEEEQESSAIGVGSVFANL